MSGNRLYVLNGVGIDIVDISDPAAPTKITTVDLAAAFPGAAVGHLGRRPPRQGRRRPAGRDQDRSRHGGRAEPHRTHPRVGDRGGAARHGHLRRRGRADPRGERGRAAGLHGPAAVRARGRPRPGGFGQRHRRRAAPRGPTQRGAHHRVRGLQRRWNAGGRAQRRCADLRPRCVRGRGPRAGVHHGRGRQGLRHPAGEQRHRRARPAPQPRRRDPAAGAQGPQRRRPGTRPERQGRRHQRGHQHRHLAGQRHAAARRDRLVRRRPPHVPHHRQRGRRAPGLARLRRGGARQLRHLSARPDRVPRGDGGCTQGGRRTRPPDGEPGARSRRRRPRRRRGPRPDPGVRHPLRDDLGA